MTGFLKIALLPRAWYSGMYIYNFNADDNYHLWEIITNRLQPDGYLTEERKAAEPDQGFSTFFSETGKQESAHNEYR